MIRLVSIITALVVSATAYAASPFTSASGHIVRDVDLWNELVTAHNERIQLVVSRPPFVVGEPVRFSTSNINAMQGRVATMFDDGWVKEKTLPSELVDIIETYASNEYTNFLQDAGMSTNGFRRATTFYRGSDDWTDVEGAMWQRPENGYGNVQAGDIVGPWIFDDLQAAFSRMKYRRFQQNSSATYIVFDGKGETDLSRYGGEYSTGSGLVSWLAAVGDAGDEFDASTGPSSQIRSYSSGSWSSFNNRFSATFGANQCYVRWNAYVALSGLSGNPAWQNGQVYFYLKPVEPGYDVFDANGTGLVEGKFVNISSGTASGISGASQYVWSGKVGSLQRPVVCDKPDDSQSYSENDRGFYTSFGQNYVFLVYEPSFSNSNE